MNSTQTIQTNFLRVKFARPLSDTEDVARTQRVTLSTFLAPMLRTQGVELNERFDQSEVDGLSIIVIDFDHSGKNLLRTTKALTRVFESESKIERGLGELRELDVWNDNA